MKAVVAAFNQEKALVGAFSVITNLRMELFEALILTESWLQRTESGEVVEHEGTGRRVLEFVSIQRKDSGEWAIPGGMVDPGERGEEWSLLLRPCRPSAFTVKELLFRIRHCLKTLFNIKFECLSTKSS